MKSNAPIRLIHGGNRSGKTELGAVEVLKRALDKPSEVWALTTDYGTSVEVQQAKIYKYLPKTIDGKPDPAFVSYALWSSENGFTNRVITFTNGSTIRFHSYDQGRERLQGTSLDYVWFDEEPPEDIYKECLMRTLDRSGRVLLTLTPVKGLTWLYHRLYRRAADDEAIEIFCLQTEQNEHVNESAVKRIMAQYSEREREVRSSGSFLDIGVGRVYHRFKRETHVIEGLALDSQSPLYFSFDFNVGFMYCSVWQMGGQRYLCLGEAALFDSNTESVCDALLERYSSHGGGFVVHGDASGYSRGTRAGESDYDIIRRKLAKLSPLRFEVKKNSSNPPVRERTNLVNKLLLENRIQLSKCCAYMAASLEGTLWRDGRFEKRKYPDPEDERFTIDHPGDTLDYFIAACERGGFRNKVTAINYR